jgi:hypothetical protein
LCDVALEDERLLGIFRSSMRDVNEELAKNSFGSYSEIREHFLRLAVACFLTMPSRSVSNSSIAQCFAMLSDSRAFSVAQKKFAIAAVNKVPQNESYDWTGLFAYPELHKALCSVAVKRNDIGGICAILDRSCDFSILMILKPVIAYIVPDIVLRFIQKTGDSTDTETLFNCLDLFTHSSHILCVFGFIRKRSILKIVMENKFDKLGTALTKLSSEDFENVLCPFDDLSLLCGMESNASKAMLCRNMVSKSACFSLSLLFLFGVRLEKRANDMIDNLFAIVKEVETAQIGRWILSIGTLLLVSLDKEPFKTIRLRFEGNLEDVCDEMVFGLLPGLFSGWSLVGVYQLDVLAGIGECECSKVIEEITECLRMKRFV